MAGREGEITIKELLADQDLAQHNQRFQGYITLNRHILTEQLGLAENDIIDLPALFQAVGSKGRAETYFPNMVNMLVLDSHLAIPKPFGPEIDGECQLEAFVRKTLNPLGLTCYFIDDWEPYFLDRGEIHCGSNVRRRPFPTKWWEVD
jgi:protein-arginine deiminase